MFSELYSAYYNAMAAILSDAIKGNYDPKDLRLIVNKYAFDESIINIGSAIRNEKWQIIKPDGTTPIKHNPNMPLTLLEKRWLKAISLDPRIKLFGDNFLSEELMDIEPLFKPSDIFVFDKYSDGDNFEDENYIFNFRLILDAIKNQYPIKITMNNRYGKTTSMVFIPDALEYSEKDDKFRIIKHNEYFGSINLGRIITCEKYLEDYSVSDSNLPIRNERSVHFELYDSNNALNRVMLHFAHFKKEAEKIDDNKYRVTLYYDKEDEKEIVIRILSFGPRIKVVAPNHFIKLVKDRLISQMKYWDALPSNSDDSIS